MRLSFALHGLIDQLAEGDACGGASQSFESVDVLRNDVTDILYVLTLYLHNHIVWPRYPGNISDSLASSQRVDQVPGLSRNHLN